MKVLGIETSCDETAVAVLEASDEGLRILSSVVSSQVAIHERFGGVVPALAAREHTANIEPVYTAAIREAAISDPRHDIGLIAVTRGPGLGPALLVGLTFARTLAMRWDKPLVGVNHLDGHIHSLWLAPEPPREAFPSLNLIVSGGHTELVLMRNHGDYEVIGETQDDAAGEAFDKVARILELGYPGGPKISALAEGGDAGAHPLPRPMAKSKNFDFSYSGLKTAVLYLVRDLTGGIRSLAEKEKADIAASFQDAAVDALILKTRRAAQEHRPRSLLLSGGVSANRLLRQRLEALGIELGIPVSVPDLSLTGDNAAMIAAAGYFSHRAGRHADWRDVQMDANLRLGHYL